MKIITFILPILFVYLLSTVPCHAYRDLETGVFLSRDPAGQVDGPNVYTYVRQNPWSAFDPEGLEGVLFLKNKDDFERIKKLQNNGDNFYKNTHLKYAPDKDGKSHPVFSGKLSSVSEGKHRYGEGSFIGTEAAWFWDNKNEAEAISGYFNTLGNSSQICTGILASSLSRLFGQGGMAPSGSAQMTRIAAKKITEEIEKEAAAEGLPNGATSLYDDVRLAGSRYANRATDVSKANFEKNLLDSGWIRSVSQDGKTIILQKDGAKFVLRDGAKSTGGPTADYYKAGSHGIDVKIRLEQGGTP